AAFFRIELCITFSFLVEVCFFGDLATSYLRKKSERLQGSFPSERGCPHLANIPPAGETRGCGHSRSDSFVNQFKFRLPARDCNQMADFIRDLLGRRDGLRNFLT